MLVSIVMPVYNGELFVEDSVNSVIKQGFASWELIVVDDCSTDGSYALLEKLALADARIRLLQNAKNQGVAIARNRGVETAVGEYVAFLDCDDSWHESKLAKQLEFMQNSRLDLSYTCYQRMDSTGRLLKLIRPPTVATYRALLYGNYIGLSTSMLRRSVTSMVEFEGVKHEDYLYWLKVLSVPGVKARLVPSGGAALVYYRTHEKSLSSKKKNAATWQWSIYRNELKLGLAKSIYLFAFYAFNALRKRI